MIKSTGWEERHQKQKEHEAALVGQFSRLEAPLIHDLHEIGLPITTIGKAYAINPFRPFEADAVSVFLKWLPLAHPRIQMAIIRCLQCPKARFDGAAIAKAFDSTDNSSMRTQLASLILNERPTNIDDWLKRAATENSDGLTRALLLEAAAKKFAFAELRDSAWQLFPELPDVLTKLLAKYGDEKDIAFLGNRGSEFTDQEKKSFAKAADKIRLRLKKKKK